MHLFSNACKKMQTLAHYNKYIYYTILYRKKQVLALNYILRKFQLKKIIKKDSERALPIGI